MKKGKINKMIMGKMARVFLVILALTCPVLMHGAAAGEVVFTSVSEEIGQRFYGGSNKEEHKSLYHYGFQGLPTWMEDAQSAATSGRYDFFAVYDGHTVDKGEGFHAARFSAVNLHEEIARLLNQGIAPDEALRRAFTTIDADYRNQTTNNDGTTAVVAFIDKENHQVRFAHIADTRALLCSNDSVVFATQDHNLSDKKERERIIASGGQVSEAFTLEGEQVVPVLKVMNRQGKTLGVTRSIGDRWFKDFGVIAMPEVSDPIHLPADGFLIIACDGVWDVIGNQEAFTIVGEALRAGKTEQQAAKALVDAALQKDSSDNISVTVVKLDKYAPRPGEVRDPVQRGGGRRPAVEPVGPVMPAPEGLEGLTPEEIAWIQAGELEARGRQEERRKEEDRKTQELLAQFEQEHRRAREIQHGGAAQRPKKRAVIEGGRQAEETPEIARLTKALLDTQNEIATYDMLLREGGAGQGEERDVFLRNISAMKDGLMRRKNEIEAALRQVLAR